MKFSLLNLAKTDVRLAREFTQSKADKAWGHAAFHTHQALVKTLRYLLKGKSYNGQEQNVQFLLNLAAISGVAVPRDIELYAGGATDWKKGTYLTENMVVKEDIVNMLGALQKWHRRLS